MKRLNLYKLYFVRGAYVDPGSHYLDNAGSGGYYWSSTPNSDGTQADFLHFNSSNVYPSSNYSRSRGLSLRCLAR